MAVETPRRIGPYEIVSPLKAGGMASLYLARRTGAAGFSKHVAIKVVHPHLADDKAFVRMFLDEALLSARIQHPNVVHVEDFGETDGMYFLVMEYVHGSALSTVLKELSRQKRRFAPEIAVWLAASIADGLHAAHELRGDQGEPLQVVHRDVSPQNVLVSFAGHVKVIDFGIAKARNHSRQTTTGSLKGKLRYMAPEQAFGRELDRRADVYALGIVLWEMLTLKRLFAADNDFALLDVVRNPQHSPPSRYAQGISAALDRAVMWALEPDAAKRCPSMQDFRRALFEAVPAAAAIDAARVAELVQVVMEERIEDKREIEPASLTGVPRHLTQTGRLRAEEVLHTMTSQAPDSDLARDDDEAKSAPSATSMAPVDTAARASVTAHSSSRMPWLLAAGGVVVLAIGLGAGAVLFGRPAAPTAAAPAFPPVAPMPALAPAPAAGVYGANGFAPLANEAAPIAPALPASSADPVTPEDETGQDSADDEARRAARRRRRAARDDSAQAPAAARPGGPLIVDDEDF